MQLSLLRLFWRELETEIISWADHLYVAKNRNWAYCDTVEAVSWANRKVPERLGVGYV